MRFGNRIGEFYCQDFLMIISIISAPGRFGRGTTLFALVLFPCGQAAPNVALLLIKLQDSPYLLV